MKTLIAICTCKRPGMLKACLESVLQTQRPQAHTVSIAVIDNDTDQTARSVVDTISSSSTMQLHYISEPRRGIPVARNAALDHAFAGDADYLVFIDDDETVAEDWLVQLVNFCEKNGGEMVVHGRVESTCPPNAPKHLASYFLRKKYRPTGRILTTCATNNVLIPLHLLKRRDIRFDTSRPLAGGTDSLFFSELHAYGIPIVECAEARVTEHIPIERVTLRWLAKRKFRAGIDVAKRKRTQRPVFLILISDLLKMIYYGAMTLIFTLFVLRERAVKTWLKTCRSAGSVSGLFGMEVDAYKNTEGS